ncbi:MAG: Holliday junction branch migration protein RuvA [Magnetococcales bacterium]|nr:Holliday junction branch migration protein RuvA [Magnetococcales bacterium]
MIAWLSGSLVEKKPDYLVLNVAGVGYRVFISLTTYSALPELGDNVVLHIVTQVREDAIHLYGFGRPEERELFNLLNSVTGVGNKLALAALSSYSAEALTAAIAQGDVTALARIPGIGRRIGQRLALELKERVIALHSGSGNPPAVASHTAVAATAVSLHDDVLSALVNLGYRRQDAEGAVRKTFAEGSHTLDSAIRMALKILAP